MASSLITSSPASNVDLMVLVAAAAVNGTTLCGGRRCDAGYNTRYVELRVGFPNAIESTRRGFFDRHDVGASSRDGAGRAVRRAGDDALIAGDAPRAPDPAHTRSAHARIRHRHRVARRHRPAAARRWELHHRPDASAGA